MQFWGNIWYLFFWPSEYAKSPTVHRSLKGALWCTFHGETYKQLHYCCNFLLLRMYNWPMTVALKHLQPAFKKLRLRIDQQVIKNLVSFEDCMQFNKCQVKTHSLYTLGQLCLLAKYRVKRYSTDSNIHKWNAFWN